MYFSKYNIFSKIKDSDSFYIVNLLTGNADILDSQKAKEIENREFSETDELFIKGYLADENEEKKLYNEKYLQFTEQRDNDEIQLFFVPWYACNFDCSYCYQSGYENKFNIPSNELIDSFFLYINEKFSSRKKYLTLFGGEPLLSGTNYRSLVKYILDKAKEANLDTAIVTNGYELENYIDLLKEYKIREVQVTLDGVDEGHNLRRPLKGGSPTFYKIVKGIDLALENNITINLRAVLDKENIYSLVEIARFGVNRGWTKSPLFKTQLGRNYELHYCQSANSKLMTRVEFYEVLYKLVRKYPEIGEFHQPAFSISKYLFENGELPSPLFDSCPGCKTEWAFDYSGNIFSCTANVGKPGSSLGTFFPERTLIMEQIEEWQDRDVTSIRECRNCSLQLACGGGCAAVSFNKTGKILSPDCRPVNELIGMGLSYYFEKEM